MRTLLGKIFLAFAAVSVITGCGDGNEKQQRLSAEQKAEQRRADSLALKIGVTQTLDCLPAFVAKDEGIFDSLGVDVRLWHFSSMLDCDAALVNRKLQGAFTDVKRIEYINAHSQAKLTPLRHTDMQWQLIANRKSRLREAKQLTDKMIAMTRHSATDFLCNRLIDSVKLATDRVFRIQINDVDLRLKMLLNNEIDAAWLPEPQASMAREKGNNVLMQSGRKGERLAVLAVREEVLNNKRMKQQTELFEKGCDIAREKIRNVDKKQYRSLIRHYYKY